MHDCISHVVIGASLAGTHVMKSMALQGQAAMNLRQRRRVVRIARPQKELATRSGAFGVLVQSMAAARPSTLQQAGEVRSPLQLPKTPKRGNTPELLSKAASSGKTQPFRVLCKSTSRDTAKDLKQVFSLDSRFWCRGRTRRTGCWNLAQSLRSAAAICHVFNCRREGTW